MRYGIVGLSLMLLSNFMLIAYTHQEVFGETDDLLTITFATLLFGVTGTWYGFFKMGEKKSKGEKMK